MLKAVNLVTRLILIRAHHWLNVNVIVVTFNIRERVMNYVVFRLPQANIATNHVQGMSHKLVQPFLV
jgi:hypothetical protein